jgi:glycosyltransferase involved in cell wall biosynthesis
MNPLVSIILPTYNGAATLNRAIKSVLSQTYQNWELIIISDGSADGTKALVEKFSSADERIIFIENEHNMGIQKTLNKGLSFAKGEYVARIDDDDVWTDPAKLFVQIAFFEEHPGYVLVGTDAIVADENGNNLSVNIMPKTDRDIRSKILSKNCFLHSTILAKKSTVKKVGGYSEKKENLHAEDYDLWLKVGLEGNMANLEIQSTMLTAHSKSLTSQNRVAQARHILAAAVAYRKKYPNFLTGYVISVTRLTFFYLVTIIPLPKSLWYKIQRIYRSV